MYQYDTETQSDVAEMLQPPQISGEETSDEQYALTPSAPAPTAPPNPLACDKCDFIGRNPSLLGIHKHWTHGKGAKETRARMRARAAERAAKKLSPEAKLTLRQANAAKARESLRTYGKRPELPAGQYYITPKAAAVLIAKRGGLYPGAVVWPPQGSNVRVRKSPTTKPAKPAAALTQTTVAQPTKEKAIRHATTLAIDPQLVSYLAGKIENELYHVAEKYDLPQQQLASAVGEYLHTVTRR